MGDLDIACLGMVTIMGDGELRVLLVHVKTLGCWCGLMALWSRSCKSVESADIGGLALIIPFEAQVLLTGLLIAEVDGGERILEALIEASSEGGNVQFGVLGMSFKEVEPRIWGDGSCSIEHLLDGQSGAGGGDEVFDLLVDIDDLCFIIWDDERQGGSR